MARPLRARSAAALNLLGATAWRQERYADAAGYYERALAMRRALDEEAGAAPEEAAPDGAMPPGTVLPGIAPMLYYLGLVAQHQGQYERAQGYYFQVLELDTAAGDHWARSLTLNALGTPRERGAYRESRAYLEESLAIKRRLQDRSGMAMVLSNLGNADVGEGRPHGSIS